MRLRPVVAALILLLVLAANHACFAKDAHAQHGARAGAAEKRAPAQGASASGTNRAQAKSLDLEATPPPVLPPHGLTSRRNVNRGVKIVKPGNPPRGPGGAGMARFERNAIGQPTVEPKNLDHPLPHIPPVSATSTAAQPPNVRGAAVSGPTVFSNAPRFSTPPVNAANPAGRGSINGAGLIRSTTVVSGIGGPARPVYGINGTAVQNKH
jgi:hypothetical protein